LKKSNESRLLTSIAHCSDTGDSRDGKDCNNEALLKIQAGDWVQTNGDPENGHHAIENKPQVQATYKHRPCYHRSPATPTFGYNR
jgi:hypothetical protein